MMITGGVSSDSTSSIVIVSTAVIAPLANSVVWDMGDLVPFTGLMDLLARWELLLLAGRLLDLYLILVIASIVIIEGQPQLA
jgi:hypothetical protein